METTLTVFEGAEHRFVCQECWQLEEIVNGTVEDSGELVAAYAASWGLEYGDLKLAVSIGPWGIDDAERRRVMLFVFGVSRGVVQMHVGDARRRHFFADLLGRPLSRVDAVFESRRNSYWRAAEAVLHLDSRVGEGLRLQIERWAAGLARGG